MKFRYLPLLLITVCILSLPVYAFWDTSMESVVMHESDVFAIGKYQIKVAEIAPEENIIYVQVKKLGKFIGTAYLLPGEPYTIEEELRIELEEFGYIQRLGNTVKLKISFWAGGKIVGYNFPETMHLDDHYESWIDIKNTGVSEATYLVELSQEGDFERFGRTYETAEHKVINELTEIEVPVKYVTIPSGEMRRVTFQVSPNRRAAHKGPSIYKEGNMLYNLYHEGKLLQSIQIPDVKVSLKQTGYITDIIIPDVLVKDVEYDGIAKVQNSGHLMSGVASDNFNFELITDGFKTTPGLIRKEIPALTKAQWGFKIRPYVTGEHVLDFEFSFVSPFATKKYLFDTFSKKVKVVEGRSTFIKNIVIPMKARVGSTVDIIAEVVNYGSKRTVDLILEAPTLFEEPQKRLLQMPPNSKDFVKFKIEATSPGKNTISMKLFEQNPSKWNINLDPTENGQLIFSKEESLLVLTPDMERVYNQANLVESKPKPKPKMPVEKEELIEEEHVEEVEELVEPITGIEVELPEVETVEQDTKDNFFDFGPQVAPTWLKTLLSVLVILTFLILVKVIFSNKR